jgi:hypothetical protein
VDSPRTSPRLGELLVAQGVLSDTELEAALAEQRRTGEPLGEILLERGVLSRPLLSDFLRHQQTWKPLGQLLLERGLLTSGQLTEALRQQRLTGRPLGEIVCRRFAISSATLDQLLAEQHRLEVEIEASFGSGLRNEIDARHSARTGRPAPTRHVGTEESGGLTARVRELETLQPERVERAETTEPERGAEKSLRANDVDRLRARLGGDESAARGSDTPAR